ncbi:hypothetical protein JXM83_03340 [Candidatus Woesearchaeota archaeon]|nr:hypothetical protein [Candidatus Woesearchaeota archaeon]
MEKISSDEIKSLMQKYNSKLNTEFLDQEDISSETGDVIQTHEFSEFRDEYVPAHMNFYEKMCDFAEKSLKLKPSETKKKQIEEAIEICHLNVTASGVYSLSYLLPIVVGLITSGLSMAIFNDMFLVMLSLGISFAMIIPVGSIPKYYAQSWRMNSGNQLVMCSFYVVTYMRHTSNLELALDFAAEHLSPPLSIDVKKILWNVETQKFENVTESLDNYLQTWKKDAPEFVETMHLIVSSLYESSETRRIELLDKSLSVMLDGTFEKMLHFAQNLKSPLASFNMLGIVMPILMLVIMPLLVSFMEGVKWYHLASLFDIVLPAALFFMQYRIMSTRPSGGGSGNDISADNPELKKFKNPQLKISETMTIEFSPTVISILILFFFLSVGLLPIFLHTFSDGWDLVMTDGFEYDLFTSIDDYSMDGAEFYLLGYRYDKTGANIIGPFGLGASLLSVAIPIGLGLAIGYYFKLKSGNLVKIRETAKTMEQEFATALFQLGNRLADGIPAELAFDRVAETMDGSASGQFFRTVSTNINKLGMSVSEAIFNPQYGAIIYFPSKMIESSMKVLTESSKKGPLIASQALINVSRYIKEMHKVDERLKDLLSETMSSMNAQAKFLSPLISGIIVGITSMITTILGTLSTSQEFTGGGGDIAGAGNALGDMFGDGMPTYFFQAFVGVYVVELIYILCILINGIGNGSDKLAEQDIIGRYLVRGTIMYSVISFFGILIFNLIANNVLKFT